MGSPFEGGRGGMFILKRDVYFKEGCLFKGEMFI